mmetsp:Transcript_127182/g.231083  ORF Transcript_127182/g.231083 Transcript_127182/m.231083 type:complete len:662 (-) Transcript_127182:155-2140(-)
MSLTPGPHADGGAVSESPASNDWTPPPGDWLARNTDSCDFHMEAMQDLIRDPPSSFADAMARVVGEPEVEPGSSGREGAAGNAAARIGSCSSRPRSSSRAPLPAPVAISAVDAPTAPSQAAPVDAPAPRSVRPLLLSRTRLPIAGTGAVAWRRPVPASPSAASSALSASVAAGAIASGRTPPKAPVPAPVARAHGEAPADRSLVSSMATRLAQVERLNQQQAMKLAKQSQELDALRGELGKLQRSRAAVCSADGERTSDEASEKCSLDDVRRLRAERNQYRQQVEEMTKFLADYGLTWVGDAPLGDSDAEESIGDDEGDAHEDGGASEGADERNDRRGDGSTVAEKLSRPSSSIGLSNLNVNMQVMESRVKSLNAMVEKEGARIVSSRVGGAVHARLVADDALPLPLSFFKDGVKLGAHAFRSYESSGAQQLVRDILDGYFPYALKDEHPDGVAMRVLDRTRHAFREWLRDHASSDPDLGDGGDRLLPHGGHVLHHARAGAAEQFFGRQPERVVRDGQIWEVRGPAAKQSGLAGSCGSAASTGSASARGASVDPLVGDVDLLEANRASAAPFVRLQVKLEGGERIVLHMELSHTVGDLEEALARWHAENGLTAAEPIDHKRRLLRTAFPPRSYADRTQTLEQAGLAPSATLFVVVGEPCEA